MTRRRKDTTRAPDLMRGVAGGALLGVPLLYTQEVWEHGATLDPWIVLAVVAGTFCLNVVLAHYVGIARGRTQHPVEEAIMGTGLSLLMAAGGLALFARIGLQDAVAATAGRIALTAVPISLGFAVASALAPKEGGEGAQRMTGGGGDLVAAAGGAVFLALNIAPTEEPVMLAGELAWTRLALLLLASIVLPYLIVFYAEFGGRASRAASDGATQGPVVETLLAYLIAFVVSAIMLTMFGRIEQADLVALRETIVLAFPASLGAALGRMLL